MINEAIAAAPHLKSALVAVGGPKAVIGRLVGFGQSEMKVGVPGWAWFIIGAAAGGTVAWLGREKIEKLVARIT